MRKKPEFKTRFLMHGRKVGRERDLACSALLNLVLVSQVFLNYRSCPCVHQRKDRVCALCGT